MSQHANTSSSLPERTSKHVTALKLSSEHEFIFITKNEYEFQRALLLRGISVVQKEYGKHRWPQIQEAYGPIATNYYSYTN
jgi:hypothetical protein